jgi:hypothetical protein
MDEYVILSDHIDPLKDPIDGIYIAIPVNSILSEQLFGQIGTLVHLKT